MCFLTFPVFLFYIIKAKYCLMEEALKSVSGKWEGGHFHCMFTSIPLWLIRGLPGTLTFQQAAFYFTFFRVLGYLTCDLSVECHGYPSAPCIHPSCRTEGSLSMSCAPQLCHTPCTPPLSPVRMVGKQSWINDTWKGKLQFHSVTWMLSAGKDFGVWWWWWWWWQSRGGGVLVFEWLRKELEG